MLKPKTRCSECIYAKNKATEKPCCSCSEIQYKSAKNSDMFVLAKKEMELC